MPPRSEVGLSMGLYAIQSGTSLWNGTPQEQRFGDYRRMGVIVNEGYGDDPSILYCPSLTQQHPWLKPGGINPDDGRYGGWFEKDSIPAGFIAMNSSYFYRETYNGQGYPSGGSPALGDLVNTVDPERDPSDLVILADVFADPTRGINDHHVDSYNHVSLDGSGNFFLDPSQEIEQFAGGNRFHAGVANGLLIERAFESFRYDAIVGNDLARP